MGILGKFHQALSQRQNTRKSPRRGGRRHGSTSFAALIGQNIAASKRCATKMCARTIVIKTHTMTLDARYWRVSNRVTERVVCHVYRMRQRRARESGRRVNNQYEAHAGFAKNSSSESTCVRSSICVAHPHRASPAGASAKEIDAAS